MRGSVVLIGDGVKESKEGRRMPGVTLHHQESDNSSKGEYIYGHLFGGVGILAEKEEKSFCIPLSMTLQDGVKTIFGWAEDAPPKRQESHVIETICQAGEAAVHFGSAILLLDRQYLSVPALSTLDKINADRHLMHIVTKAKSNCTAYHEPEIIPGKRGAPRKKGDSVKVFSLFEADKALFKSAEIKLRKTTETPISCRGSALGETVV
jgi:hypothetical protein